MTRETIHEWLDQALDNTREGEHFLPEFVKIVLEPQTRKAQFDYSKYDHTNKQMETEL